MSIMMALAGAQVLGSLMSSKANKSATNAQVAASDAAIDEQRRQFDTVMDLTAPQRDAGNQALNRLLDFSSRSGPINGRYDTNADRYTTDYSQSLRSAEGDFSRQTRDANSQFAGDQRTARNNYMDATRDLNNRASSRMDAAQGRYETGLADARGGYNRIMAREFEADPGYQFRLQQGERALERGASARGNAMGSATMQALNDFNSGLASQEFGNFDARRNRDATQSFSMDSGIAGNVYSGERSNAADDYARRYGRTGSVADMDMAAAGNNYNAAYGRAGDVYNARTGTAGERYGARMGQNAESYGRTIDTQNALLGMTGVGQGGTSQAVSAANATGSNIGNALMSLGDAQASGAIRQSNIWNNTIDNGFNLASSAQGGQFGPTPGFGITPNPAGLTMWGY
jgi:hypothetical protein